MSDSEAPLLCPVCLVSMGVQLSEECAELGEREETYILNTNLTSRGKKLLKLLISKTRLIKIFEVYRDKVLGFLGSTVRAKHEGFVHSVSRELRGLYSTERSSLGGLLHHCRA